MSTESSPAPDKAKSKFNGQARDKRPRVITSPGDVAGLVMMQIDAVNSKKDDLTIAIIGSGRYRQATRSCLRPATGGD